MTTAEEYKAKGNEALLSKNYSSAIENYTHAINIDGSNHVYYSNRSAAYLSKGDANNALEDANACIGLNPTFAKGYSRKGAALHALKRYNDSVKAYEEGIDKCGQDKGLISGLESVKKERDGPPARGAAAGGGGGGMGLGGLFGPEMIAKIALDPKLRTYMADPDFMTKLTTLQKDPNSISTMLGDKRILEVFQFILGMNGMQMKTPDGYDDEDEDMPSVSEEKTEIPSSTTTSTATAAATAATSKEMEVDTPTPPPPSSSTASQEKEEDLSHLTPDELQQHQNKKLAITAKEKGNNYYKNKQFNEAIAAYDEAISLDPTSMTFHSNKAAVYFTQKKYEECIDSCQTAVQIGNDNRAPYEERAKAYTRAAKAYQKMNDLDNAIEMCKSAQLESYDKTTQRLLKTLELEKKQKDALDYQDDDKAEEAKQLGNTHFRNKDYGEAVKAYEDAVKRAPKNATIRNNLAAALCKIMDFNGAKREIEVALDLDPKYVKAWSRKADIEVLMKEYHKALESYKKGLELDPTNAACKEGLRKVTAMINYGAANMTEEERKERAAHAMADPEIQSILQDPVVQQVLRDFNENPNAANQAMADPNMRSKIEKLIASGILQTA
jgi:stress-induced-phosphoprotein 1